MTQHDIKNLSLAELKELEKQLALYADLSKKLGRRGRDMFKREMDALPLLVVEYYPSLDASYVASQAIEVYKKVFGIEVQTADITLVSKEEVSGGMKVYKDDSMVDVSFSKIEKYMK